VRSRIDDHDAWEEATSGRGGSGRGRKKHARNGCDDHRTGIRCDDDGIEFGERGPHRGLEEREVELAGDHIAYDLTHGDSRFLSGCDNATEGGGSGGREERKTVCSTIGRGELGIAKHWGCGGRAWKWG
jgi:hypothetical protein